MEVFFVKESRPSIRLEVLSTLHTIIWLCKYIAEEIVIEKVLIRYLSSVHLDADSDVRKRGVGLIVEVLRNLEDDNLFNTIYNMLLVAASSNLDDVKDTAVRGIISIFGSCFHLAQSERVVRVYSSMCSLLVHVDSNSSIRKNLLGM